MNRVSKKLTAVILCTGAVALAGQSGRAALPSGNYDQHVASDSNPIWDVTRVVPLNNLSFGVGGNANVDLQCHVSFTMDGAGKLNGKGTTDILVDSGSFKGTIPGATYKVTGSITSQGGAAKLLYTATLMGKANMEGKNRTVTASATFSTRFDAVNKTFSGTYINKASASGLGGGSEKGSIDANFQDLYAELGTGYWTLHLMDLANNGKTKITAGTATVVLDDSSKVFSFKVKGVYAAKTGISTLALAPSDAVSKGSTLTVTMSGQTITAIKGKVAGQTIKLTLP